MPGGRHFEAWTGTGRRGLVYGLFAPKPASGLTLTYSTGIVEVAHPDSDGLTIRRRIAGTTKVFTASKDTYAYVDSAGTITYIEKALGAAKPTQDDIGKKSEFLWKVVTNATDITSVNPLYKLAGADLISVPLVGTMNATAFQATYAVPWPARLLALDGSVALVLGATDTGAVTPKRIDKDDTEGAAMTNGALSFAISAAVGVRDVECPTADNLFDAGERLILEFLKVTAGGEVVVTCVFERLP